ncbi:esterase/lipase family protein [Flavobacterium sp.]|uniref:esterase/lipase family protein n=1 Tax=Flavobacterium sp. TaxID=239 RepID=UPI00352970D2
MKIPVYFIPGLAASSEIFNNIKLPNESFETYFLEWFLPSTNESLQDYAKRMALQIQHKNPVLIGVSFGGIIAQEIAKHIETKKVIIISSIKSNSEMPKRMKIAKLIKLYRLLPTAFLSNIEKFTFLSFSKTIDKRLKLYKKYFKMRDKKYLDWALKNVILWQQNAASSSVIHIHGEKDEVFPAKNIKNCILVKNGTHIMIINQYKWLNKNLPCIIIENNEN